MMKKKFLGYQRLTSHGEAHGHEFYLMYRVNASGSVYARIKAGCRTFTLAQAKAHWSRSPYAWTIIDDRGHFVNPRSFISWEKFADRRERNDRSLQLVKKAEDFIARLKKRK